MIVVGSLRSTSDVPTQLRYAYWQDLICDVLVDLDCSAPQRRGFSGSIYSQSFCGMQLSTMVSDQMSLTRSRGRIARAREDEFLVAFEGRTRSFGAQDGREAVLEMGDFALFDSTRPYDVGFTPGFQHYVLKIPRSALLGRIGAAHGLTGCRIPGSAGAGRLASSFFRNLQEELDGLDQVEADRLGEVGLDLLAAALVHSRPRDLSARSANCTAWITRIKAFINAHLTDPDLSPRKIAAVHGVSVRYLHSLFLTETMPIDRWMWERRLQRCYAALADPCQRGRSISDIAFGWGFTDLSHFSRTFKQRFGLTPRDFRAAGLPQKPQSPDDH